MTLARFLFGIPLAIVALVPVYLGARALRRVLVPGWAGLEAWLADFVLWLVAVVLTAEFLGTFGLLSTWWVVIALAAVGTALHQGVRRIALRPSSNTREDPDGLPEGRAAAPTVPPTPNRWQVVVAGLALLPLAGSWLARTLRSMANGTTTTDTLWYHLTVAARFVQTGRTTSIHFLDADPVTAYFPATSPLLHALAMLLFASDVVSTVVNLGWLSVALAAAWLVGRPFGVAPATMIGAALLLAGPGMVETQPGGALNDVIGIALLLTALAFAVRDPGANRTMGQDLLIGLAAGLSIGMKFTFIAPAVALCLALVVTAPRGTRIRRTLVFLVSGLVSGGYWYLRNLIAVGNPLPSLQVSLGPFSLPYVEGNFPTQTFSTYVLKGDAWQRFLFAGLQDALGPAWWLLGVFVVVGIAGGIVDRDARVRMLAILCAVNLAVFAVSPQYLDLLPGVPYFFPTNLRYAAPGLVFGLVLFPMVLRRWSRFVLPLMAAAVIWTQADPVSWPTGSDRASFFMDHISWDAAIAGATVTVLVALVIVGGSALVRRSANGTALLQGSAILVPVLVLLGLGVVHGHYVENRYTHMGPRSRGYEWARTVDHARIGVEGTNLQLQYPYTGNGWTNHVQYLQIGTGDGGVRSARSCEEWVDLVAEGRYDYVVLYDPKLSAWAKGQPDARLVRSDPMRSITGEPLRIDIIALDSTKRHRAC